jgi:hypothetical protein
MPDATWPDFAQHLKNRLDALEAAIGTASLLDVGTSAGQIPQRQEGGAINFPVDTNRTTLSLMGPSIIIDTDGHLYFHDGEAWIQVAEQA